jgi:8-oxo-dGTP pyrophosphatase MutT (NUDIX family)
VRAAVVVVDDGEVALIERRREGRLYFLLPGGGVELGQQSYVDKVTAAANGLVVDRFFLQEDAAGYTAAAQALQTGLPAK